MSAKVTIKDYSDKAKDEIDSLIEIALEEIGLVAERYAARAAHVDTGRLRASISHATEKTQGRQYRYQDNGGKQFDYDIGGGAEKDSVYIGTNVEYAPYVEKRYPFLRPAASSHGTEYSNILKKRLGEG